MGNDLAIRDGLTDMQREFVNYYVLNGGIASNAARSAGYAEDTVRQCGYRLTRLHHVQAAIREGFSRELTSMSAVALQTLRAIMSNENAPYGARVDAAKTILDRAGYGTTPGPKKSNEPNGEKSLEELTIAELEERIAQREQQLQNVTPPPGVAVPVDSQPIDPATEVGA